MQDQFSERKMGLAAWSMVLERSGEVEAVWPSFFFCRDADISNFDAWLDAGLTEALRRWAARL